MEVSSERGPNNPKISAIISFGLNQHIDKSAVTTIIEKWIRPFDRKNRSIARSVSHTAASDRSDTTISKRVRLAVATPAQLSRQTPYVSWMRIGSPSTGQRLKTSQEGRITVFIDESGLDQRPHRCRTWAPRGQTPCCSVTQSKELPNFCRRPSGN